VKSRIFAAAVLGLTSCRLYAAPPADCGNISTKYFSWAALKVYPPRPTNSESEGWGEEQEANGASHYIAEYCNDGRIVSLTKRLNRATFFRYDYFYNGNKLIEVRLTDETGKTRVIADK
jgi:hypothetical protein